MGYRVNIKPAIQQMRELKEDKNLGQFAAAEAARLMEQYVPKLSGALRGSAQATPWKITYSTPYAKRQFYGYGIKHYSTPSTTSHWDKPMNKISLAKALTAYLRH